MITSLFFAGYTTAVSIHRRVIRKFDVSERTVGKKLGRLKRNLSLHSPQRLTRNDKFLNGDRRREIEEFLERNPFANAKDIIKGLNYPISDRTMQRALEEMEYKYKSVRNIPLLQDHHQISRLDFARLNFNKNWANVIFVDEVTFQTYTCPKNAYQNKYHRVTNPTPKHPLKIHAWAGISTKGISSLYLFTFNLTGIFYKRILKTKLLPFARDCFGQRDWFLLQDNDPKHKSQVVKKFLENSNVQIIDNYPSCSPDLNPIENIWAIVKSELSKKSVKTLVQLRKSLRDIWNHLDQDVVDTIIASMPNRMNEIMNNNGSKINY
jgi:transposase